MRRMLPIALMAASAFAQSPRPLTLQEAEVLAIKNHPRIAAANFTALATQQTITQTRANLYPVLAGNVTGAGGLDPSVVAAGGMNVSTVDNRFASGIGASQLVTDFGRTQHLIAQSKLRAEAQEDAVQTSRADALLQVDRAYFDGLRAQAVLRIAEQTVAARQLVADQVAELARSNLKSGLDVSFANVNLAEAKLLLVSAKNQQESAFAQLAAAIGERQAETFALSDLPAPGILPYTAEEYVQEAMRSRPELASSRATQRAAAEFAAAENALKYPALSIVSAAGVIPGHDQRLTGRYVAAGVNLNLPLFNGRLYAARHEEALLRERAAGATVNDQENAIARDVRVAWLNASTALQRIGLTAELLAQAAQALDLAQARYELGLSSIIELSQAQLNRTAAEIQNVSAKYDFQSQFAVLQYQAGLLR